MARGPGSSTKNRAIHQYSTADARAQGQQRHIAFSAGSTPEDFRNECCASVIIGVERQTSGLNHVFQEATLEEVQVSRQAVYPGGCSIDNALASDTDSARLPLGLSQDEVYKIMKGGRSARRRSVKALDQISAQVYKRSFDGGAADVYANCNRLIRRNACLVWAHNRCALYALYAILVGRRCIRHFELTEALLQSV
jgi:hypothetical protein